MEKKVEVFASPYLMAEKFAGILAGKVREAEKDNRQFTIALSGGKTPGLIWSVLCDHFGKSASWDRVHYFWGDERCVPPWDGESNYGAVKGILTDKLRIPPRNIHRIIGENDPVSEAARYSEEILAHTEIVNGLPSFSLVMLGLGEDGHTASIFPGQEHLLNSDKICDTAFHPITMQRRITLTGRTINNAGSVYFFVTGKEKAAIVEKVLNRHEAYPASAIIPSGELHWFLDKDAARLLKF